MAVIGILFSQLDLNEVPMINLGYARKILTNVSFVLKWAIYDLCDTV